MLPYAPWIVWAFPLVMAFTHFIWERISHKLRDFMAVATGFVSAIFAASMIPDVLNGYVVVGGTRYDIPFDWVVFKWIPVAGYEVELGVLVDPLSVFMANVVAWISSFILLYSVEYLHGDRGITRYWMLVNFFIGVMQLLVLSDNLLIMFFGWEGVGFASYALIGYWYSDEKKYWIGPYSPSHCGMKAFITTRVGDVGLLISLILIFIYGGTLNFMELASSGNWILSLSRDGILTLSLILMFLGPIGKSAQFPLHVWLPEAMAGPTTVSALIHAATMVKAGVYFIARFVLVLFSTYHIVGEVIWPSLNIFFLTVAWIGAFTAFLAASMGMVSDQIKKVLAYSTVSQLGYMFAILGVSGLLIHHSSAFIESYLSGIYHLFSHAIFKALLFLSAGAIGHAIESYMLKDMGGLKRYMPKTFMVMVVGAAALSGIPPFNGFWSKDAILHSLYVEGVWGIMVVLVITAILTVFYTFRMVGMAFYGSESKHVRHLVEEGHKPHDPGLYMSISLWVLAFGALVSGFFLPNISGLFIRSFEYLGIGHEVIEEVPLFDYTQFIVGTISSPTFLISLGIVIIGLYSSWGFYIAGRWDPVAVIRDNGLLRGIWTFLYNRWYINALYYKVFVGGVWLASNLIFNVIEANGGGEVIKKGYSIFSSGVRRIQTGYLRLNMVYIALGLILFLLLFMVFV
jgi:NADH-quinone oxidoreductase subunit L